MESIIGTSLWALLILFSIAAIAQGAIVRHRIKARAKIFKQIENATSYIETAAERDEAEKSFDIHASQPKSIDCRLKVELKNDKLLRPQIIRVTRFDQSGDCRFLLARYEEEDDIVMTVPIKIDMISTCIDLESGLTIDDIHTHLKRAGQ